MTRSITLLLLVATSVALASAGKAKRHSIASLAHPIDPQLITLNFICPQSNGLFEVKGHRQYFWLCVYNLPILQKCPEKFEFHRKDRLCLLDKPAGHGTTRKHGHLTTKKSGRVTTKKPGRLTTEKLNHGSTKKTGRVTTKRPGHFTTKKSGRVTTRKPGHLTTKKTGRVTTRKPGHLTTKKPGRVTTKRPGHFTTKKTGRVTTRKPGHLTTKKTGRVTTKKPGRVTTKRPGHFTTKKPGRVSTQKPSKGPSSKNPKTTTQSLSTRPVVTFKCPSDAGYFQHQDCRKFWQCSNGKAHEKVCPDKTSWDQKKLTCDHSNYDCESHN